VIPESQIDDSVRKILRAKASVGLNKGRLVDLADVARRVSRPESLEFAQQVADAATTLVKDNGHVLPLSRTRGTGAAPAAYQQPGANPAAAGTVAVILTDDVRTEMGRAFQRAMRARAPQTRFFFIDWRNAAVFTPEVMGAVNAAEKVVVAAYVIPQAAKQTIVNGKLTNTVGFDDVTGSLVRQLLGAAAGKTVVIAMGSPYLAQSYPEIENYLCTYSSAPTSEEAAVKALFGEMPLRGKLPVSLPGIAQRGFGLTTPGQARPAVASSSAAQ
jgi:beta-N-acetylhexosaminidase